MKSFALGSIAIAIAILLSSTSALAAHKYKDTYKDTYKDVMPEQCANWTGPYVGLNAGYGWGNQAVKQFSNSADDPVGTGVIPASLANSPSGFIGGAQLGYNYQYLQTLVGIEADWQWTNISDTKNVTTDVPPFAIFTTHAKQQLDWLATLRARLGVLPVEELLVYVTGGLGYGNIKLNGNITNPGCVGFCGSHSTSSNNTGWTAGAGLEYAFTDAISAKAEYLYYDLGNQSQHINDPTIPGVFLGQKVAVKGNLVRAGINYKFM